MHKPPYMPLYVDDFEADTAHLSLEEDGVYNRLLRLCWRTATCSIPEDPRWIARRMRVDIETYHRVIEPIIKEFFQRENGRLFQGRQRREFNAVVETYKNRARAGAKGGRPRNRLNSNDFDESRAKAMQKPGESNQNQNHTQSLRPAGEKESRTERFVSTRETFTDDPDGEPF